MFDYFKKAIQTVANPVGSMASSAFQAVAPTVGNWLGGLAGSGFNTNTAAPSTLTTQRNGMTTTTPTANQYQLNKGMQSPQSTTGTTTTAPGTTGTPDQSPGSIYDSTTSNLPPWYSAIATLPKIDFNAWNAQAQAQATADVTPLFTQKLNNYLAQQNLQRQQEQTGYAQQVGTLQAQLGQYMEQKDLEKARTGQDYEKSIWDIAANSEAQQQQEAFNYDLQRRGAQEELGTAGLSTSGLGRQSMYNMQKMRGMSEEAQAREVENQRYTANLMKTRTFEDIAMGVKQKNEDVVRSTQFAKTNMDEALRLIDLQTEVGRLGYDIDKEQAIQAATQNYLPTYWANYFNKLSNNQKIAATNLYGAGGPF